MLLLDSLTNALPRILNAVWKHAPVDRKRQILARVRDLNPFTSLPNNDNLRRAARLAWIDATLTLLEAAQNLPLMPDESPANRRFLDTTRATLIDLRHTAFDRSIQLTDSPIDTHLPTLTLAAAEPIDATSAKLSANTQHGLMTTFATTLSHLTGGETIPTPLLLLAQDGVQVTDDTGNDTRLTFGELAFNAFGRLLCDPAAFPEGREALRTLIGQWSLTVAKETHALLITLDTRLNQTVTALSNQIQLVLDTQMGLLIRIDDTVGRIETKLDEHAATLKRLLAQAEANGAVARAGEAGFTKAVVVALIERMDSMDIQADGLFPCLDSAISKLSAQQTTGNAVIDALCSEANRLLNKEGLDAPAALLRAVRYKLREISAVQERLLLLKEIHYNEVRIKPFAVVENFMELAIMDGVTGSTRLGEWFFERAKEYHERGERKGDNIQLYIAIELYKVSLKERPRHSAPLNWAKTLNNLGSALSTLGQRKNGSATLKEAVVIYRSALTECQRALAPLEWATIQNNLGNALSVLGELEGEATQLEEAVYVFRSALEERTRNRVPLQWAKTQTNLGNALKALGDQERGTKRLMEAIAAYHAALKLDEFRNTAPLDWARTQDNLGIALSTIGFREKSKEKLEESITAHKMALEEHTRERFPLKWAETMNNIGNTFRNIGMINGDNKNIKFAITAYRSVLEERKRERLPLDWAKTQDDLGNAMHILGKRMFASNIINDAINSYNLALEERTRDRVPLQWAMTQNNLSISLFVLGIKDNNISQLIKAFEASDNALKECKRSQNSLLWAEIHSNQGNILLALGKRIDEAPIVEKAVESHNRALEEYSPDRDMLYWGISIFNKCTALMFLAEQRRDAKIAQQALSDLTHVEAVFGEISPEYAEVYRREMVKAHGLVVRLQT